MLVRLIKDHDGFGKAGEEVEVNSVRGRAWIEEGIAEDPKEKKAKGAKREKKDNAGPGQ